MSLPASLKHIEDVYIVSDFMDYDLSKIFSRYRNNKEVIDSKQRKLLLVQILRGIEHTHCADVIHRDIKP